MQIRLKTILIAETCIILLLGAALIWVMALKSPSSPSLPDANLDLLSKRVVLDPDYERSFSVVNLRPMRETFEEYIRVNNLNMSIYVENLRNGANMGIREKEGYTPASLNKLPLAILIMRKIENGELSLDTPLKIQENDRTDTSGDLYKDPVTELPLSAVLEKLLRESDNTAMNVLLHYVSSEDIQFMLDYYGLDLTLDFVQIEKNYSNLLSPKIMATLFLSLYSSTILEPKNSQYLLSLMEHTTFPIEDLAQLHPGTRVVHKFGERDIEGAPIFHDCGIIYDEESRLFYCIMTSGVPSEQAALHTATLVNGIDEYVRYARQSYKPRLS